MIVMLKKYFFNEGYSFIFLVLAIFFEYVRPQGLYEIQLPFSQVTMLILFIAFFIENNKLNFKSPESKLINIFLMIILLSSLFAFSMSEALGELPVFIGWVFIYYMISSIVTNKNRFMVFTFMFLLFTFKLSQFVVLKWAYHGFTVPEEGIPAGIGWFRNTGEMGIQFAICFPIATYFFLSLKKHLSKQKDLIKKAFFGFMALSFILGTITTDSRGCMLASAVVILWLWVNSKKKILGVCIVIIIAGLFLSYAGDRTLQRFHSMGQDRTSMSRLYYWKMGIEMGKKYPFLGVGYHNWFVAKEKLYPYDLHNEVCHNTFIEAFSELGYSGLAVYILMIIFCFRTNLQTRKIAMEKLKGDKFIYNMALGLDGALIAYLVSGFFVTVLYYPFFWVNLGMTSALKNTAHNEELILNID